MLRHRQRVGNVRSRGLGGWHGGVLREERHVVVVPASTQWRGRVREGAGFRGLRRRTRCLMEPHREYTIVCLRRTKHEKGAEMAPSRFPGAVRNQPVDGVVDAENGAQYWTSTHFQTIPFLRLKERFERIAILAVTKHKSRRWRRFGGLWISYCQKQTASVNGSQTTTSSTNYQQRWCWCNRAMVQHHPS